MKKNAIIISILATTVLLSCKKSFLEVVPKGNLVAEKTNDYNLLLNNLDLLNVLTDAQVAMGDEVAAVEPFFSGSALRTQRLFRWEDVIYEPDQDAVEMTVPMRNIYTYNKIINEVMDSKEGTEAQKKSIRAEALAGRAWTYFLLINYYGKPYSASAANDPGYPIITKSDVTQTQFSRATVQEVYDFIITDLTTAIPDAPARTSHRLRMSKPAAEGILAKVYMTMGRFTDALPLLNNAIAGLSNAAIPVRLYDYNVTFGTGGSFLPIGTFGPAYPTVPNIEENLYAKQFVNSWAFSSSEIVMNPQTVALFRTSDLRLRFFTNTPYPSGTAYPSGMLRKRGQASNIIGLTVPDLYLMRAECKSRLNDLTGAKADVEFLRARRMPSADVAVPAAAMTDAGTLTNFILEERIREFAVTGYRWFDMRRLSVDPVYNTTVKTTHTLYTSTGTTTFTLRPERFVLRFPQKVMEQNPGMQNNQ